MLDPAVKLGTSTPGNDPAGDYAWAVFRKAEVIRPGSRAALEAKALQLTGNDHAAAPPPGQGVYAWNLAQGRADLFLIYCTNGQGVVHDLAGAALVELPPALATGADYGVAALTSGNAVNALALLAYLLSPEGQAILARHGFDAPLLPAASR